MTSASGLGRTAFIIVFTIIWTAFTIGFGSFFAYNIYQQKRAESFAATTGEIVQSEIRSSRTTDGTIFRAEIEFTYTVDSVPYRGDTYRFGAVGTSDRTPQQRVVRTYPVGSTVDVYYDPDDPATVVLEQGVGGTDMFMLLFLTPFILVMIFLWATVVENIMYRIRKPPAGGVPIMERPIGTVVRLPRHSPMFVAGTTAFGITFVSIFIVTFATRMDPGIPETVIVWIIAGVSAVAVYLWRRFKVGSGAKDLVIDDRSKALLLPQTFGRNENLAVLYENVADIRVEQRASSDKKGDSAYSYAPTIIWHDDNGNKRSDTIAESYYQTRAEALAQWIRQRIGFQRANGTQAL